jgi:hypothetical protein
MSKSLVLFLLFTMVIVKMSVSAQTGESKEYSTGMPYKLAADILEQLRQGAFDYKDQELYNILQNVRIIVPYKSLVKNCPNAYAQIVDKSIYEVSIEMNWLDYVEDYCGIGALYASVLYGKSFQDFYNSVVKAYCIRIYDSCEKVHRTNIQMLPGLFNIKEYLDQSDTQNDVNYLLFERLNGIVWMNTMVWTVLHEVGHHVLKHTKNYLNPSAQIKRQLEYEADSYAFKKMVELGYSLFGVYCYFKALQLTEYCINNSCLPALIDTNDSDHPSWTNRSICLENHFDVLDVPANDSRFFIIPLANPKAANITLNIPDRNQISSEVNITNDGDQIFGVVEWKGDTAVVYLRVSNGGRQEYIIREIDLPLQIIEIREYDKNNHLVIILKCPSIQQGLISLGFMEINGMKLRDISNSINSFNLMINYLEKTGAPESAIQQVVSEEKKFIRYRSYYGLKYVKGEISSDVCEKILAQKSKICEEKEIEILGEKNYRNFMDSYNKEIEKYLPPQTGIKEWEDGIINNNLKY